ncbi:C1 family peptidase [Bombilactobacillus bombi]|uniref:aminopeptidase C n=1 Tax=Bombilactobacillus bombi TaxID=1303590 RepID=UPI002810C9B0|nr:C1 family peptidase [Bombilactobacillus bombi]
MQAITETQIKKFQAEFRKQKTHQVIANAVQTNGINQAAQNLAVQSQLEPTFSVEIKTGKVSNQKQSGRCWLFAALTLLRTQCAAEYGLKDFELSQNYLSFYDRLEKANWFYQRLVQTAHLPLTDRTVAQLLADPDGDGGQWSYAVNLIKKYGVVPKSVMPETYNSEHTQEFSTVLKAKLRKDAKDIRNLAKQNPAVSTLNDLITAKLAEVYRICVYAFGQPPRHFDLELRNDQQQLIQERGLTPQEFAQKYCSFNLDDWVGILNAPQDNKELGRTYCLENTNMVGAKTAKDLNLPIQRLEQLAIQQLQAGQPVWFGNDVLEQLNRQKGLLASGLYDYNSLFGIDLDLDKGLRLDYGQAAMSHAMVLTGVDLDKQGQPLKWKVENSWGDKIGTKGYFVMSVQWFRDYVYEVIIKKSYLSEQEQQQFAQDPLVLPSWDAIN